MVRPLVDELIDDIVEQLASIVALGRDPAAETTLNDALLARDTLETDRVIEREELEAFARDHPVAEPYDPDDSKERDQF